MRAHVIRSLPGTLPALAGFLFGATGLVHAAEPLRLADVLEQARQSNPQIRAARERAAALAAVPPRVAALDDPTVSYELWNAPDSFRADRADNNIIRLSQKLPFPGKRALAGTMAEDEAEAARRDVDGVELEVTAAVKRAYYDLWSARELLDVYSREQALVQRFAHIAEQKYGVSEVSQSDVLRAQVELTRLINRVTTQTLRVDSARAGLNVLLSRSPDDPLGVPEDAPRPRLDESPEALMKVAVESRPELAAQRAAIAREEAAVRLARRDYYPDFELSVGRFINPGRRDGFGAMAAVSIPIAYKWKYDAAVAEASGRLGSAQAELRRMVDRVRGEVKEAYLRAQAALLQRNLFVTTHIPQAEQSLRVAESAYGTGAIDFLSLIDTARTVESVHVEHIEAEADFGRASADLERAAGRELPPAGGGLGRPMETE
jgi:cobalt-zinc-cadmium efflux system outer membrane protein